LQKCKSIDDVVDAFVDVGFKRAHEVNPNRKALSITPSGGDFLNVVLVNKPPSGLQPPEKKAGVHAALYVSNNFKQYKFFRTKLIFGKEMSYSFTSSMLKSPTQLGNLARMKINGLKFDDFDSIDNIVDTSSEQAIRNFEENLGAVIDSLRNEIKDKLDKDFGLKESMEETARMFSSFIGPEFAQKALVELLIQHLLTKDIFAAAYGKTFQRDNVVANSLERLAQYFADIPTLIHDEHDLRERRDSIIQVIELNPTQKRLEIIKMVYEAFYSVYNPLDADRLGIVYTPKIAVDFIIRSTNKLMSKHLQATISNKGIHIIDPCIGTGTFMISLLNYMKHELCVDDELLISKYTNELHANEVSILAYYIAAMNVERTFESITKKSKPFSGVVWRDTLLSVNLDDYPIQRNDNVARMKAQQNRKITVILGNPPYNVGQKNFGDGNSNPIYFSVNGGVDDRITQTYHQRSQFKKQTRDMYKRFVRWASDRIGNCGIVSFISNNSFVHANNYDGMRACLIDEFDYIYICDLRGNAYLAGEAWRREGDKFFGAKSRVGVAIYFLIKTGQKRTGPGRIYYADVGDYKTRQQKLDWIDNKTVEDLDFVRAVPDLNMTWVGSKSDLNYRKFVPLISFNTKQGKCDDAVFRVFTNGIKTGADDWQTDFNAENLKKKMLAYSKEYNRVRLHARNGNITQHIKKSTIPWYSGLDRKAYGNKIMKFMSKNIFCTTYRPFVTKYFYYDAVTIQAISKWPNIIQHDVDIPIICVRARSAHKLECVGMSGFVDHVAILHSQNVPLYRLDDSGELISNVTDFGRMLFYTHYQNRNIRDEDIFYYCYAVLNDPEYIEKYGHEVRTLHPRIPLHPKFHDWCSLGKMLFDLHTSFKKQPKYKLNQIKEDGDSSEVILNLIQSSPKVWKARMDGSFSIDGIPEEAADPKSGGYVIGARTPIGWVLEHYQKACRLSTSSKVPKKFALLNYASHKNDIVDLIHRLCTVSVETSRIQNKISKLPHSFVPCEKSCCKESLTKTSSLPKKKLFKKRARHSAGQKKL